MTTKSNTIDAPIPKTSEQLSSKLAYLARALKTPTIERVWDNLAAVRGHLARHHHAGDSRAEQEAGEIALAVRASRADSAAEGHDDRPEHRADHRAPPQERQPDSAHPVGEHVPARMGHRSGENVRR
ncbi:hypothetical protein GCM10009851_40370 [Herbiconiux moechotypicola]|uniref:Uncharacterized protein n=1 Tax=Herbiconiux moechotypicola TaxID=637393 RepID=A0ABN3E892_9MICO|nr:hypothetical protein [Herbiconiux moechotypicola]